MTGCPFLLTIARKVSSHVFTYIARKVSSDVYTYTYLCISYVFLIHFLCISLKRVYVYISYCVIVLYMYIYLIVFRLNDTCLRDAADAIFLSYMSCPYDSCMT